MTIWDGPPDGSIWVETDRYQDVNGRGEAIGLQCVYGINEGLIEHDLIDDFVKRGYEQITTDEAKERLEDVVQGLTRQCEALRRVMEKL